MNNILFPCFLKYQLHNQHDNQVWFRSKGILNHQVILDTNLCNRTIREVGVRRGGACEDVQDERVIRISHHPGNKI